MDDFRQILKHLADKEGDELVDEFKRIFQSRIPNDIHDLITAKDNRDFPALRRKAHFLSTSLLTLRFDYGFAIASELQKQIDLGEESTILSLSDQLIDYLNSALNELE